MICRDQPQRPHLPQPTQAALPSLLRQALEAADERAFCEAATSHKYSIAGAPDDVLPFRHDNQMPHPLVVITSG
jgi:hypothetical protein